MEARQAERWSRFRSHTARFDMSSAPSPDPSTDNSDDDPPSPHHDGDDDPARALRTALGALRARLSPLPENDENDTQTND